MKKVLLILGILGCFSLPGYPGDTETYEMLTANVNTVIHTRDINYVTIHSVNIKQAVRGTSELIINVEMVKSTGEHVFEQYVETLDPGHTMYSIFVADGILQNVGE